MKSVEIKGASGRTHIAFASFQEWILTLPHRDEWVVVAEHRFAPQTSQLFSPDRLVLLGGGEELKQLAQVEALYHRFFNYGLDRASLVLGIGGGALCDVVGFTCATYLRGIRCALVPTTLLAQVDGAIGGKSGLNFAGHKNLIGTIRQPELVLIDSHWLKTLSARELRSGIAEIVKHALIADTELFELLWREREMLLAYDRESLQDATFRSVMVKKQLVENDEFDCGERAKLNFGHSIAHALEIVTLPALLHGEAVSMGMVLDLELSVRRCGLAETARSRAVSLLRSFGLPTEFVKVPDTVKERVLRDKKRSGKQLRMGLLTDIGCSAIYDVPVSEVLEVLDDLCKRS